MTNASGLGNSGEELWTSLLHYTLQLSLPQTSGSVSYFLQAMPMLDPVLVLVLQQEGVVDISVSPHLH